MTASINLPRDGAPLTLLALEADDPLTYVFEVDHARSVSGAFHVLSSLFAQLKKNTHGELLHADDGRLLALYRTQAEAERAALDAHRLAAEHTRTLTLTSVIEELPARMLTEGRFPAPTRVVGVPGVSPYQARINRYYGLDSPYTVPTSAQLATRQHFGQVIDWLRPRLEQERHRRDVFPFHELIGFAEPCPLCRIRPAEAQYCGVCARRSALGSDTPVGAFILTHLYGFEKQLSERRTPHDYAKLYAQVQTAYQRSLDASGLIALQCSGEQAILTGEVSGLPLALSLFASTYANEQKGQKDVPLPALYLGVGLGAASPVTLWKAAQTALSAVLRSAEPSRIALQVLGQETPLPVAFYPADGLLALQNFVEKLRAARFPADVYTELGLNIARGTASLYYGYGRMRLEPGLLRVLDGLETEWGRESARYFRALYDALTLARLVTE
jgi:hypothetical protein